MNSEEDEFRRIEAEALKCEHCHGIGKTLVYGIEESWEENCLYCNGIGITPAAQPEPTPWRDMVVATLVREGVNKHRARELADHFAAERNNG